MNTPLNSLQDIQNFFLSNSSGTVVINGVECTSYEQAKEVYNAQSEAGKTDSTEVSPAEKTVSGEKVTDDTVVNEKLAPAQLSNEDGDTQPNVPHEPEAPRNEGDDKTSMPSIH